MEHGRGLNLCCRTTQIQGGANHIWWKLFQLNKKPIWWSTTLQIARPGPGLMVRVYLPRVPGWLKKFEFDNACTDFPLPVFRAGENQDVSNTCVLRMYRTVAVPPPGSSDVSQLNGKYKVKPTARKEVVQSLQPPNMKAILAEWLKAKTCVPGKVLSRHQQTKPLPLLAGWLLIKLVLNWKIPNLVGGRVDRDGAEADGGWANLHPCHHQQAWCQRGGWRQQLINNLFSHVITQICHALILRVWHWCNN